MVAPIVKVGVGASDLSGVLDIIRSGGLVIAPTTTNYNLICDATNALAVERVFEVKKRTKWGPLPISLPHPDEAARYVEFPKGFDQDILRKLLPGEISFIFRQKYGFPDRLTCGSRTVAISCTTHPVFRAIVVGAARPIAATSANLSGQGNIFVTLQKAVDDLGELVDVVVDAGPSAAELAGQGDRVNTIIDLTFERPYLVRSGWVALSTVLQHFPTLHTDPLAYQAALKQRVGAETVAAASA